jgi:hypothetical protein
MRAVADAVGPQTAVIAAAYADAAALDPPALAPAWLPGVVDRSGIAGALVDTFVKDGRGLYAWLSEAELADLSGRTRRAGAIFGVAGQLRRGELGRVDADIVGVRSAVCRGGDRAADLDTDLVAAAVAELRTLALESGIGQLNRQRIHARSRAPQRMKMMEASAVRVEADAQRPVEAEPKKAREPGWCP